MFHAFAFLDFKQLAAEHTHCCFAVLNLAAFVLALNNDTRREMRYADRGGCFVNMLSACSARTISINTDIIGIYLNIARIIVKNRSYIQRGKRGVPAPGGVKRGDSNKPVNTLFRLKVTVGIVPLALKGDGLDARFLTVEQIQFLHNKTFAFAITCVHAVEQADPILRFRAACTGMKAENGICIVVRPAEHRVDAELFNLMQKLLKLRLCFKRGFLVIFFLCHIKQG